MYEVWGMAALWLWLALVATLLSIWFRIATALSEIMAGTPFYFIRAGSYVSVPAVLAAPAAILVLFLAKMATKMLGVYPATKFFRYAQKEGMYTTLLMSTGLTFGSISALFGLTHGIIDKGQYSLLILVVIGSAVVPTIIANAFFIPKYLLPELVPLEKTEPSAAGMGTKEDR